MDIKRTVLWVIFTMSLFMLWDNWARYNGKPSMFSPAPQTSSAPASASASAQAVAANGAAAAAAPGAAAPAAQRELITITTDVF